MNSTNCCVCFEINETISVSTIHSNEETIISKLRKLVSEVIWKECFTICPQCLKTLDIVEEFRKTCLRTSVIRLEQEESELNCMFEQCQENAEIKTDFCEKPNPEHTADVISEVCETEMNSKEHNTEICNPEITYENDSVSIERDEDISNYSDGDYSCQKCNESFSSKSEYENHVKKHNVFICFHCNKGFKSKVMLAKHIRIKHDVIKDQLKESEDLYSNHMKYAPSELVQSITENSNRTIKMFKCDKCEKAYKTEKVMINHMITCDGIKRHSKMNYPKDFSKNECVDCGRFYTTEKNLKAHIKHCKKNRSLLQKDSKCYMCDIILKDSKDKFEHVLKEHNINLNADNTCQYCYKQFLTNENLQSHLAEEHDMPTKKSYSERSYSCEVCSKIFGYVKEVIEHCVKEHQMDPKSVKPYLCDKCCTRFTSSANIIQHKQYHEGERSHICSYCGKSFITKSDLTVHEYTHLNRRNYKCEICERAFNTNKNLRSHKLVVHTDSSLWKYQCKLCDKKFPLKSGYDQHIRRHSGDKRFKCLICEKTFVSSSELNKHKIFHSDERAFKCSHCSKEYKDRRVYEVHLTKVHGIGNAKIPVRVKKFVCHICPSRFFDKQKLSRHMCTHTGIKPFVCNVCEKRFSDKSYLKSHMKLVHNFIAEQSKD